MLSLLSFVQKFVKFSFNIFGCVKIFCETFLQVKFFKFYFFPSYQIESSSLSY